MRKLIVAVVMVALLGGYAYADEVSDSLEREALAVINAHKSKLDAEDAVQRAKDAEIEKQRNLQADELKKEKLSQEQMQRASARADEARAKAEAERKARADLELRLRAAELEEARKARRAQIIHNMIEAGQRVDAQWEAMRAREQQSLDAALARQQAARDAALAREQAASTPAPVQQQIIERPIIVIPPRR